MSFKNVNYLRKSGQLQAAYQEAIDDLKSNPDDSWSLSALFWVLRDCCNKYIVSNDYTSAKKTLSEMSELLDGMEDSEEYGKRAYESLLRKVLPESNTISQLSELSKKNAVEAYNKLCTFKDSNLIDSHLHEEIGWIIYRYLKAQIGQLSSLDVRKRLRDYMLLQNERPSMLHSSILTFAINFTKGNEDFNFYQFFLMWGPENLRYEDFHESYWNNNTYPSLLSRIIKCIMTGKHAYDVNVLCDRIDYPRTDVLDLFREGSFWNIINLHKEGKEAEMFQAFNAYNDENIELGPSKWHSEVLKAAERYMSDKNTYRFLDFMKKWGFEKLNEADWKEVHDDKGNTYPSLAVKCAKKSFDCLKARANKENADVQWLEGFYQEINSKGINDDWLSRQLAIIHIWQGRKQEAISEYKNLLLELPDKYYIWSELAECVDDLNLKISMYSKALLLENKEEYLGNIRLQMAESMLKADYVKEALCELNRYQENHPQPNSRYEELIQKFPLEIQAPKNNVSFYKAHEHPAVEFVYSEIPSRIYTLVDRWEKDGKSHCVFSDGEEATFTINARRFPGLGKLELGGAVEARCQKKEDRLIPLYLEIIECELWHELPGMYGYVQYLNEEKKVLHILTKNSILIFCPFSEKWDTIHKGDFVSFRQYCLEKKGEKRYYAADLQLESADDVIDSFQSLIAVVDDVNRRKELFHVTAGYGKIGGIVHMKDCSFLPEVGQPIKIWACISRNKKGEKSFVVLKTEQTDQTNESAVKTIEGDLRLHFPEWDEDGEPDFAFVDDCYVHCSILKKFEVKTNCHVIAEAVYSGNGKWKIFSIEKLYSEGL